MPRGNGTGPQGSGRGGGQGRAQKSVSGIDSPFQKSSIGATIFAFASMLIGNWLDKKLSKRKVENKSGKDESG